MINMGDTLSTVEDIMSTVGVILSSMGDTQYRDIRFYVEDMMSNTGVLSTVQGYHPL